MVSGESKKAERRPAGFEEYRPTREQQNWAQNLLSGTDADKSKLRAWLDWQEQQRIAADWDAALRENEERSKYQTIRCGVSTASIASGFSNQTILVPEFHQLIEQTIRIKERIRRHISQAAAREREALYKANTGVTMIQPLRWHLRGKHL